MPSDLLTTHRRLLARAVVIDLDELDFDQPQVLQPLAKNDPSMFDIAISPELLAELAAN